MMIRYALAAGSLVVAPWLLNSAPALAQTGDEVPLDEEYESEDDSEFELPASIDATTEGQAETGADSGTIEAGPAEDAAVSDTATQRPVVSPAARPYIEAPRTRSRYTIGQGISFDFEEDGHRIGFGGVIQPRWGVSEQTGGDTEQFLNVKRARLVLSGELYEEALRFFVQSEFTLNDPLLDAWFAYSPFEWLTFTFGQRLTTALNREAQQDAPFLAFTDRSLLSRTFSETGREFGGFLDFEIPLGPTIIRPQLSVTSGDGRNSFGVDSRDRDIGGLKWGGRLDVLPLGDFVGVGKNSVADLTREHTPKLVIGASLSYNDGASEARGAGHGEFQLYDGFGGLQQPDYVQIFADLLVKWRGASLLIEYTNATATGLQGTFTDEGGNDRLFRRQISEFLLLGDGFNGQVGYVFDFGLGIDLRYSELYDEFPKFETSLLQDTTALGASASWYFVDQALKAQLSYERIDTAGGPVIDTAELLVQLML